jgi:hypothetical protein
MTAVFDRFTVGISTDQRGREILAFVPSARREMLGEGGLRELVQRVPIGFAMPPDNRTATQVLDHMITSVR